MSDPIPRAIIADAIAGDHVAQADLYARIRGRVWGILRLLTGSNAVDGELCTDLTVYVFTRLQTFRWRSAFTTWMYSIVVRRFWKVRRKIIVSRMAVVRREPALEPSLPPLPDESAATREVVAAALEAVSQLPERLQEPFLMLDIERIEPAEVARCLGTSVGAVQDRAHRARMRIRKALRERGLMEQRESEAVPGGPAEMESDAGLPGAATVPGSGGCDGNE